MARQVSPPLFFVETLSSLGENGWVTHRVRHHSKNPFAYFERAFDKLTHSPAEEELPPPARGVAEYPGRASHGRR
jgi:hypothetical protein